jgi:fermentation-respiration switch protein FrsA (DUF1100 family)
MVVAGLAMAASGCAMNPRPLGHPTAAVVESSATVMLHGKPLALHLSVPQGPPAGDTLVLYASGDGGWFGTAVDMFHLVGRAGYYTVGFSSKAFLHLDRPKGKAINPERLAEEYGAILARTREAMHLAPRTPVILTGWSRGASFAVLAGAEAGAPANLSGVIGIGLSEGENLEIDDPAGGTDDDAQASVRQPQPLQPYRHIARLGDVPCAVIQASRDGYLPASRARELFGPDTAARRFYAITADNHRFTGGREAFARALLDAIHWMNTRDASAERPRRLSPPEP